ncbi:3-oxoacyl-[acyl-carrier-protein] synthase 2 [Peptoniphilus sp. ING2-D1G]|nr:3-oxoacyl-[acyl-carrier-protein] synthase 2 [Peptoniphilus sp. ING2-D1G]
MRRVVITGLGGVTPIGSTKEEILENIIKRSCAIDEITHYDTSEMQVKLAAEVKNFKEEDYFDKKSLRRLDRVNVFGIVAARKAVEDSGLTKEEINNVRTGVYVSSGIGGLMTIQREAERGQNKGYDKLSPYFIPMAISNLTAANIAMDLGTHGPCICPVTACAGATNAIGEAYRAIKHGYSDIILAGGSEASITELGIGGFTSMKALSLSENKNRASIPFDMERSGFVMGEGSAILILEEYQRAKERGAYIYGEIIGYGANCDAYHITAPYPGGEYAKLAMTDAMREGELNPEDVDYINAHGTSTVANDATESRYINEVFKGSKNVSVSSCKSQIGHMLGASGSAEIMMTLIAMKNETLPTLINYEKFDPECDLNFVTKIEKYDINCFLKNSLGFGGHNATIAIRRI